VGWQQSVIGLFVCLAGCGRLEFEVLSGGDPDDAGTQRSDARTPLDSGGGGQPSVDSGSASDANRADDDGGAGSGGTGGTDGGDAGGAGGADAGSPVAYCSGLPALAQAPVLEGDLEAGLQLQTIVPVGWRHTTTPLPAGHEARFAAAWRADGLYFYIELDDPDLNPAPAMEYVWKGDSVEVYVDHDATYATPPPNYDATGTRQFFIASPSDMSTPGQRAQSRIPETYSNVRASQWISVYRAGGYKIEVFITAPELALANWTLSAGQSVGFDLAHNVSFPPGQTGPEANRLSQYFLSIREPPQGNTYDYPYLNESVFCSPILLPP